jgi:hypothetical protein
MIIVKNYHLQVYSGFSQITIKPDLLHYFILSIQE